MSAINQNIKPWGNSLGVRLPAVISRAVGLKANQCVQIVTKGKSIVITPCDPKTLTLEERLARFDPLTHGGEVMVSDEPIGAEKW